MKVTNLKHFTSPNYTVTNIVKVLDCGWKYCLLFSALQSYCFYCLLLKMLPNYFKCPIFFIVLYFFLSIQISYLNHRFEFVFWTIIYRDYQLQFVMWFFFYLKELIGFILLASFPSSVSLSFPELYSLMKYPLLRFSDFLFV